MDWSVLIHILKDVFIIIHLYGKPEGGVFHLSINKFLADICAVRWFYSDKNDLSSWVTVFHPAFKIWVYLSIS